MIKMLYVDYDGRTHDHDDYTARERSSFDTRSSEEIHAELARYSASDDE